jgi:outer membrane protein W
MKRRIFAVAVLAMLTVASSAFAAGKGTSMLSLGLGQNQANALYTLGGSAGAGFQNKFDETNVGAQYTYMFSDDYQIVVSGAYGFGSVKVEDSTTPTTSEATLSSYRFRVGGDRVGKVGDRFVMYIGPGLEYASAKTKLEETGLPDFESESSTTYGISGRIGGIMMLSDAVGITGELTHTFGMATYEEGNVEVSWMPNTLGAFWGLTFAFGGSN